MWRTWVHPGVGARLCLGAHPARLPQGWAWGRQEADPACRHWYPRPLMLRMTPSHIVPRTQAVCPWPKVRSQVPAGDGEPRERWWGPMPSSPGERSGPGHGPTSASSFHSPRAGMLQAGSCQPLRALCWAQLLPVMIPPYHGHREIYLLLNQRMTLLFIHYFWG